VALTAEGVRYLRDIGDAFLRIAHATDALSPGADEGMLRIKLPPTCAIRWLVPRLGRFHARHPKIAVQVTTSHDEVIFGRDDIDVAIAYGESFGRGLVVSRLFGEVLMPVCSPKLLGGSRQLTHPAEVARYVLLHSIRRPSDWHDWFRAAGVTDMAEPAALTFENSALTYQGAVDGLGIAIAQLAFVSDELASGRLVAPLALTVKNRVGYHLVYPREREAQAKNRAFQAWIAEEAAAARAADPLL
jgi:LysR family glycine cleavage system transcriptional activator